MARLILKAPYYKPGHKTESGRSRGGYAEYIATREGVEILRGGMLGYIGERHGSNGLFSDEGEKINLSAISREIDEHQGNVWGMIISLKREDAERLGYNSAEQWINLLRSRRNDIAKEMHILTLERNDHAPNVSGMLVDLTADSREIYLFTLV